MPKKSKRRIPKHALVLDDVVFKLGIREIKGIIHGQQGMAVFICEDEGIAEPLSFSPPIEAYETEVSTFIRTYDKSIVLEPGVDDKPVDKLREDRGEIDASALEAISEMAEGQLLKRIPDVISGVSSTIFTTVLAIGLAFTPLPLFPFVVVPGCIGIWGFGWSLSNYKWLNSQRVYDAKGNWINLKTGRTSLNHGTFRYRMEE